MCAFLYVYKYIHKPSPSALQNKCILLKPDAELFCISRTLTILDTELLRGQYKLVLSTRKWPLELHIAQRKAVRRMSGK